MRRTFHYLVLVLVAATSACAGSVTSPDRTPSLAAVPTVASEGFPVNGSSGAAHTLVALAPAGSEYDLGNGSFTMTTLDGDISGDYTGHVSISSFGRVKVSLDMNVTGGTQGFLGATGSLAGDGTGAFVGEGSFSLSLRGSVSTAADPGGFKVRGTIAGTSRVSCSAPNISVTLTGEGSLGKPGDVHAVLTHLVVSNSGCIS